MAQRSKEASLGTVELIEDGGLFTLTGNCGRDDRWSNRISDESNRAIAHGRVGAAGMKAVNGIEIVGIDTVTAHGQAGCVIAG